MTLPWRTGDGPRPAGIPLPSGRMPLWRGRRPLKRWRYVGYYSDAVMLCVASARIGPFPLSWWAVWDRGARTLVEDTRRAPMALDLVETDVVRIELALAEAPGVETVSRHGAQYIWTRKQVPHVTGSVTVAGRTFALDGPGIIDDSAGYHARHTAWLWSAGTGTLADGRTVAWNLVDGVHDSPASSERTVWVEGVPHEVGPVRFADDLSRIEFAEGGALEFSAEAVRSADENLLLVRSAYEQPFGTFGGALPGAGELAGGHGVTERHDVRW